MNYQERIKAILESRKSVVDPRHVEGFMRLQHGTLDGLSVSQFKSEVLIGSKCAIADKVMAEKLALSYNL